MASAPEPLCTSCSRGNVNVRATNYCKTCNQHFCKSCLDPHDKLFGINNHDMVSVSKTAMSVTKESHMVMCSQHPTEVITLYCYPHDSVFCQLCKEAGHRDCIGVEVIAQACESYDITKASEATRCDVEATWRHLTNLKALRQKDQLRIETEKETAVSYIHGFRRRCIERLDKIEREALEEVKKVFYAYHNKTSGDIATCEQMILVLERLLNLHSNAGAEDAALNMFIFDKTGEATLKQAHYAATAIEAGIGQDNIQCNVETCTQIEDDLKHATLIHVREDKEITTKHSTPVPCPFVAKSESPFVENAETQYMHYDVKTENDSLDCNIKSICQLDNGYFVMSDSQNNKLKVFEDMKFVCETKVGDFPTHVCQSGPNEVSVGMFYMISGAIMQFNFEYQDGHPHLVRKAKLKTKHNVYGLTYNEGEYFMSSMAAKLYAYDRQGTFLGLVYRGKDIKDIKFIPSCQTIFVSDAVNGFLMLNRSGEVLQSIPTSQIEKPTGIAAYIEGGLFVCDDATHAINFINQTRPDDNETQRVVRIIKTYATKEIKPIALCYNVMKNTLVVSFRHTNFVHVLQLMDKPTCF